MSGHDWFEGFDKRACYGDHPETDEVCPKLQDGVIDTCGVCGCTIMGLSMSETPPTDCVRRNLHAPETDGGHPVDVPSMRRDVTALRWLAPTKRTVLVALFGGFVGVTLGQYPGFVIGLFTAVLLELVWKISHR